MGGLKKNLLTLLLAVLLAVCLLAAYLMRGAGSIRYVALIDQAAVGNAYTVDQHLIQTARQVAPLADTASERGFAQEALRLADHHPPGSGGRERAGDRPAEATGRSHRAVERSYRERAGPHRQADPAGSGRQRQRHRPAR